MTNYINIPAFFIGLTTAFFAIFAIHILFWRRGRTRFQTMLGYVMAIWAVWNLKDIVVTFPGMYNPEVLNWILIIDGWSALTYTALIFEAVWPGWVTLRKFSLTALPFAAFTIAYALWPNTWVFYAYIVFLWFYAWTIVIIGYIKVRKVIKYVRENFSNIERIDVAWLKPVFAFAIISQLSWLFTSLFATILADILYYISSILLWLMVLYYSWDFRPIDTQKKESEESAVQKNSSPITEGALECLVEEQRLYLNPNLTLSDIAQALKTNRTYASNYLSQVRGQTFYDYINQLRIEKVSIPLMKEHPEYKLDFIAQESGFASISTFRRAFVRLTGQTPSQFEDNEEMQK